ncbi:hypothetical protein [Halomonas elongata]|uniref:hypothetical protein n=1 Tax=Halomonas elongata TaxID=2746 RepID=UPI0023B0EFE1|nr:hypothetical protein [Halomonas elongata]
MSSDTAPYETDAYRAAVIPSLPAPQKARERRGEDLLPFGDYAYINPYQQLCDDAELVQYQENEDPNFYQSQNWWWGHQRIRFLKSQTELSILLMAVPFIWFSILLLLVLLAGLEVAFF